MAYGDRLPLLTVKGYVNVYAPEHPLADSAGYVREHRKVAWDSGILMDRRDHVHHANGVKTDNRPENLEAISASNHGRLHGAARVKMSREEHLQRERDRNARRRPQLTCAVCGRTFGYRSGDRRSCSNKCSAVLRRQAGVLPRYKRRCEVCDREFRTRTGDGRACSPTCRADLRRKIKSYGPDYCTVGM